MTRTQKILTALADGKSRRASEIAREAQLSFGVTVQILNDLYWSGAISRSWGNYPRFRLPREVSKKC